MDAGDAGRLTELSPSLLALTPVLDHITVVSNLELRNAYTTGNHASSNCAFLSCSKAKRTEGSDYELGTTVDQIAAKAIGRDTPIPSLEIGTDLIAQVGNCDNGYACAYQNNLSWSSPTTPLPTEADPRVVFERLFGDGGSPERRRAELKKSGSILDWMTADMARLQTRAGRRRSHQSRSVSRFGARGRASHSACGAERRVGAAGSRSAGQRARGLGRPRQADVRPAGAGASGRRDPRRHVPAGARNEHAEPTRTSACPSRIIRCRITPTIRRSW